MARVAGGYTSNTTGVFITNEEFDSMDEDFRSYVYEEEPLTGMEEHIRDTQGNLDCPSARWF